MFASSRVMWPSNQHVVKVGGRGRSAVPKSMVENYVDRYPSQLPGGALEGALPPGRDSAPVPSKRPGAEKPEYDAKNPHPDIEHYDPNKVKIPDHKDDGNATPKAGDDTDTATPARPTDAATPAKSTDAATPAKPSILVWLELPPEPLVPVPMARRLNGTPIGPSFTRSLAYFLVVPANRRCENGFSDMAPAVAELLARKSRRFMSGSCIRKLSQSGVVALEIAYTFEAMLQERVAPGLQIL
jgi:hypothetical protein